MNKIIYILISFIFFYNTSGSANEIKCKIYDVICKSKQVINETKEYQKKAWSETPVKKNIKKTGDLIKNKKK